MDKISQNETTVLIVDDEAQIRRLIQQTIQDGGYTCLHASNGEEALEIMKNRYVDVVITDIAMPKMDGIMLTEKIRAEYDADVIMMTGHVKDVSYRDAIARGSSDFIQKPFDTKEVPIRLNRVIRERSMRSGLEKALKQSQQILEGLIHSLSLTIEARDPYTSGHQNRVAVLASDIAKEMGFSDDRIAGIRMAGTIHDLGKIAIPAEILSKPTRLTEIEFSFIKNHSQVGFDILKDIRFPLPIADIVYQHHERMDGSGYPQGISGKDILPEARILAIADVVEAMSSHRPYRPALGIEKAIHEISKNKGIIYDFDSATACMNILLKLRKIKKVF